ncbi:MULTISPECIES: TetR family transcriptional regulator [unclassified Comamonas]|uniref:TetR family transcriptional regulator n=1 Tax=unclassified Comamonas TaxID=2638500 RepID=UPI001781E745|nr:MULTISPECIES: TetR family transcriptional regulator [unclassified Comamonas]MBD9403671.1 TetR family transcriptional regulator [Comamonas sp. CMM02]
MARRTKEDAEATRNRLLDAAQEVFHVKGVRGASLLDVAQAASLTRGAIYWHFKDKADLFDAMMQRVTSPFEQACFPEQDGSGSQASALQGILDVLRMVLHSVNTDAAIRSVFEIALYKVECVGEMFAVRERRMMGVMRFNSRLEGALMLAAEQARVELPVSAASAAIGLHAVFDGVLHAWLLHDARPFDLETEGMAAVSVYLKGLGLGAAKEIA